MNRVALILIVGLDPALPFFATNNLNRKLDASDADFVDVIHSNAGIFGKIEPSGHLDFYMNGGQIQPACKNHKSKCAFIFYTKFNSLNIFTKFLFWFSLTQMLLYAATFYRHYILLNRSILTLDFGAFHAKATSNLSLECVAFDRRFLFVSESSWESTVFHIKCLFLIFL